MQFKKEEARLAMVINSLMRTNMGKCPGDEEFALYLERRLDRKRESALQSHFASCRDCRERLAFAAPFIAEEIKESALHKIFASVWKPAAVAPALTALVIFAAYGLNIYFTPSSVAPPEQKEVMRGGELIAVTQTPMTPALVEIMREGNEAKLISELSKSLPQGVEISRVAVDAEVKSLSAPEGNLILILYSDGLLKIKSE